MSSTNRDDAAAARIVVGVDGSAGSARALEWAAREARLRGAVLEIVHADFYRHEVLELFAPDVLRAEKSVAAAAARRARELEPGIVTEVRIADPPAHVALIEASKEADMLVVGSHGLSGMKELMLGSVSRECVHHAHCPVVVIPPPAVGWSSSDRNMATATGKPGMHTTGDPGR